jgi:hypothetical protein
MPTIVPITRLIVDHVNRKVTVLLIGGPELWLPRSSIALVLLHGLQHAT